MIFKLVGIALTGIVAVTLLKNSKPEFSVFATIATGVVMVISMLSALGEVVLAFDSIVEKSGVLRRLADKEKIQVEGRVL